MGIFYILLIFQILTSPVLAQGGNEPRETTINEEWLALLHYQKGILGYKSTIDNPEFFLSQNGKFNPAEELEATRNAFEENNILVGPSNLSPLCAFPARVRYIERTFNTEYPDVQCPEFEHWNNNLKLKSISLVFTTAYSGNPASMLGHTFLKLNLADSTDAKGHDLLDYGAAYSAAANASDGMMYMINGLTGGYPGVFGIQPYYELVSTYSYNESRDLWEFELNLNNSQLEQFVAHFWELYSLAIADYYFLDDNCSYMLLELLDAVMPELKLASSAGFIVLPHQTIHEVVKKGKNKQPVFRPSVRKMFLQSYESLNKNEKQQFDFIIENFEISEIMTNARVLNTALYWVNFRKAQLSLDEQADIRRLERSILSKRATLTPASNLRPLPQHDTTNRPDLGHSPSKVSLGFQKNDNSRGISLGIRHGLHDLMDPPMGYEPYYHLNYLNFKSYIAEEWLQSSFQLEIIDVMALFPLRPYDLKFSWQAGGRIQTVANINCPSCFGLQVHAGIGAAYGLMNNRITVFSLPGTDVLASSHTPRNIELSPYLPISMYIKVRNDIRLLSQWRKKIRFQNNEQIHLTTEMRTSAYFDIGDLMISLEVLHLPNREYLISGSHFFN